MTRVALARGNLASVFLELGELGPRARCSTKRSHHRRWSSKSYDYIYGVMRGRSVTARRFRGSSATAQILLEKGRRRRRAANARIVMFDTASSDEEMDELAGRISVADRVAFPRFRVPTAGADFTRG
jgi:hypothetical protein